MYLKTINRSIEMFTFCFKDSILSFNCFPPFVYNPRDFCVVTDVFGLHL